MKTLDVKAKYKPREWAKEFHESPQRWKVLVLHRRAGKTTACINHLIRDACRNKNSYYAFISPTYKQGKRNTWDMFKEYSSVIPGATPNESELLIRYPNGAKIQLFGADEPDSLRGLGLWGVVYDESSQHPASLHSEVVSKALADHLGYAIWIGTPKGRNEFHRRYEAAKNSEDYYCAYVDIDDSLNRETGPTIDNLRTALEDDKKEIQMGLMTLDEFNQEWYLSWDAAIKGAYYSHQLQEARKQKRICKVSHREDVPVYTYWDLGISDYTTIVFAQKIDREIHIIDYYENNGCELDHYAMELRRRPYQYGAHYLPHDVQNREMGTGRSRLELLGQQLGRDKIKVTPNISLKDGIDAARFMFNRCWFDEEKTQPLLDALASYTQEWDDKRGMYRDKPLHNWASHAADAFRYLAVAIKDEVVMKTNPVRSKYNKMGRPRAVARTYNF